MSELDQILARAQAPGRFAERRQFTLSRARAIEKLREFALRRPGQAVLELIQAAVFSHATYIAIDTRSDRVVVAWVGAPPLQEAELEDLFDYLFVDTASADHRHLVQLALAVNAMLREDGGRVRIESGSGQAGETLRLDVAPDGEAVVGSAESALAGTYVAMERPRKWWRFWSSTNITEEQVLVEEQCRYTPVPILLNGHAPFGYRASRQIRAFHQGEDHAFDEGPGGRRGIVYLTPRQSRIDLVVGGVRISTVEMPDLGLVQAGHLGGGTPHRFSGVVCDDRLRKTADQSDIVRDRHFQDLLQALREPTTRLARQAVPDWTSPVPGLVRSDTDGVALPETIDQLAPRARVALADLSGWSTDVPLFCMTPQVAAEPAVQLAADPQRLPFPVLVLPRSSHAALEAHLGRPVGVLIDSASVDLAARAAAGTGGLTTLDGRSQDHAGRTWRAMVWSSEQPMGLTGPGEVPLFVHRAGQTTEIRTVPLDAPGLCVEVDGALPDLLPEATLVDLVLRHAGRLALEDESVPRPLRCRLAARVLRIEPSQSGALQLGFPPGWAVAELGADLDAWSEAIHSGGRLVVTPDVAADWLPLERMVATGHLGTDAQGVVVAAATYRDEDWSITFGPPTAPGPALLVHDGPVSFDTTPLTDEPFLTGRGLGELSPAVVRAGGQRLVLALRALPEVEAGRSDLRRRWTDALATAFDEPSWTVARPAKAPALRAGVRPLDPTTPRISLGVARASRRTGTLGLPTWAGSRTIPGGWAAFIERPEGWLGIPSTRDPYMEPPRILVDTGLDRVWYATAETLPCVGELQVPYAELQAMWPSIVAVWLELLATEPGHARPWVAFAARVVDPASLMGALLGQRLDDASRAQPGETVATRALIDELHRIHHQDAGVDWMLEQQARVLRHALGGPAPRLV